MARLTAIFQLLGALLLLLLALVTLVNLLQILPRPETISVVNTLIGQVVLIIGMLVMAHILFRKGRAGLKDSRSAQDVSGDG